MHINTFNKLVEEGEYSQESIKILYAHYIKGRSISELAKVCKKSTAELRILMIKFRYFNHIEVGDITDINIDELSPQFCGRPLS